jgi:hypothetical protein
MVADDPVAALKCMVAVRRTRILTEKRWRSLGVFALSRCAARYRTLTGLDKRGVLETSALGTSWPLRLREGRRICSASASECLKNNQFQGDDAYQDEMVQERQAPSVPAPLLLTGSSPSVSRAAGLEEAYAHLGGLRRERRTLASSRRSRVGGRSAGGTSVHGWDLASSVRAAGVGRLDQAGGARSWSWWASACTCYCAFNVKLNYKGREHLLVARQQAMAPIAQV